ncbi:MAG TPA: hypothetical protein VKN18_14945 [Blastocatellia bacterium]|nr:hypothetical protein [Blastocatellia bacterium]
MIKSKLVLFLIGPILSAYVLMGCATPAQTGAAAMAGGLLGTTVAVLALTNSSLKVTVDMYGPTEEQRSEMRLNHPTALMQSIDDKRQTVIDPVQNPTAQNMKTVKENLRPIMERIEKTIPSLDSMIAVLTEVLKSETNQDYRDALKTMEALRQAAAAELKAWKDFDATMKTNMQRLDDPTVLRTLASQLSVLRESLLKSAGSHVVTTGYIRFLRFQILGALGDVPDAAAKLTITDNPAATDAERIGIVLDAVRQLLGSTSNHDNVNARLRALGISLDSQQLLALGSREAIVKALTPSTGDVVFRYDFSRPKDCEIASALIALPACSTIAYNYTFSRATADYNTGPINNEVAQVLQAANRSLTIISEPGNADRWRLSANAKSRGGAGNQNSIIYFENMALPVVKNAAFDPTKFVVAAGALYRQVFAASVAAFGAPLPATAGTPGGPDMQSSNIIATRARILNAEKAATAARQKILDTLKMAIDQQAKVKSGDWTKNQAAIVKTVQDAVQGAATQLDTVGSPN